MTVYDRVPITPIPRGDVPFDSLVMDCLGPLFSNQKVELPLNLGKTASEYLEELKRNLEKAQGFLRHTPKRLSNDTFRGIICEPEKSRLRLDRKFWF